MNILNQPLAHVVSKFILDGKEYEMEHFNMVFSQPTDYKGQPQHETKGGQLTVMITEAADDNLYEWAKRSTQLKSGEIVFQTELSNPVMRIRFTNAYCAKLKRLMDATTGTTTTLFIAPEIIEINGIEHDNFWNK